MENQLSGSELMTEASEDLLQLNLSSTTIQFREFDICHD